MKNFFLGIMTLVLVSCGSQDPVLDDVGSTDVGTLGALVSIEENESLGSRETEILDSICKSLAVKEAFFSANVINKPVVLNYQSETKICGATEAYDSDVGVKVVQTGGDPYFEWVRGSRDFFGEFETTDSGYFANLCKDGAAESAPRRYQQNGSSVVWVKLFDNNSKYCPTTDDTKCAVFLTGSEQPSGKVMIRQIEALTINVKEDSDLRGMVVVRGKESKILCERDKVVMISVFEGF